MAQTTGVVLAIGGITLANESIFHNKDIDWRVPAATGIAALAFAGAEHMWAPGARMLAWTALAAVCLTRIDADIPSPVESALLWWNNPPRRLSKGKKQDPGDLPGGKKAIPW